MSENPLVRIILEQLRNKEKITFAEFMDTALYHPEYGFYQKENPFGEQGSFYTSVNASSSFGRSIAEGFISTFGSTDIEKNICEMGAGNGFLAKDILDFIREKYPQTYENMTYTVIEKSGYLVEKQKAALSEHVKENKVKWISFDELENFSGIFFSNELVDAFPVHRIINIEGSYKELYVIENGDRFELYPDEISTAKINDYINNMGIKINEKQIIDINLNSTDWIFDLGNKINRGLLFTIDYGFEAKELFSSFRMDGTATCYFRHQQNNNFFDNIGYQDITAFVDFTALDFYGKKAGLEKIAFIPQWLFLIQSGILYEMENASTDLEKSSIKSLIIPEGGFGTNFHVLIQSKNISIPENFIYKKSSYDTFEMLSEIF